MRRIKLEVMRQVESLATASPADIIRLCWMEAPTAADLEGLDLRLLLEYERKPGGAVRVKLLDRADLLCAAMKP